MVRGPPAPATWASRRPSWRPTFDGPYAHKRPFGARRVDRARSCAEVRAAAGPAMTLMVDVQYAFDSVERALAVAEQIAEYDIFFLETPLWTDDIEGYARLTAALTGADRLRRVALLAARVPPADRALGGERGAARHRPGGRTHRGPPGVRHGGRGGAQGGAARVEDRHLGGGRGAPGDGHAAHAVLRVPAGGVVRVAAAQGADRRRDGVRRRPAGDPAPVPASASSSTATRWTSSCRLRPVLPEARAAQVSDALDAMGVRDRCISQLRQFVPGPAVVGTAFTMQCAPAEPGRRRAVRGPAGGARCRRPR